MGLAIVTHLPLPITHCVILDIMCCIVKQHSQHTNPALRQTSRGKGELLTGQRDSIRTKIMYQIIDTHAHLDEIENLEEAIAQAKEAGLAAIVAVGSDMASNQKTLEIAAQYKGFVYPAWAGTPGTLKSRR